MKEPLNEPTPTVDTPSTPYHNGPSEKTLLPPVSSLPPPPLPTPSDAHQLRSTRLAVWRVLLLAVALFILYTAVTTKPPHQLTPLEELDAELVITESEAGSGACQNAPYFAGDKNLAERLGYTLVVDVPRENIPGGKGVKGGGESNGRVIVVGDVHGMFHELVTLLKKVQYDQDKDYLVFAGDMISKGPDSLKVVDLARSYGAGCVRGNHEDRVLLHYHQLQKKKQGKANKKDKKGGNKDKKRGNKDKKKEKHSKPKFHNSNTVQPLVYSVDKLDDMEMDEPSFDWLSSIDDSPSEISTKISTEPGTGSDSDLGDEWNSFQALTDKKLAKLLNRKQAKWLDACPLVLRMNKVSNIGQIDVVHAGLVHGVSLKDQDPNAIMNMRTLDKRCHMPLPEGKKDGIHWADVWNQGEKYEKGMEHTTVVYGHFAAKGLDIRPYSKGLDSNCVRGGRLSAYVVSSKKEVVVSVKCRSFLKD